MQTGNLAPPRQRVNMSTNRSHCLHCNCLALAGFYPCFSFSCVQYNIVMAIIVWLKTEDQKAKLMVCAEGFPKGDGQPGLDWPVLCTEAHSFVDFDNSA